MHNSARRLIFIILDLLDKFTNLIYIYFIFFSDESGRTLLEVLKLENPNFGNGHAGKIDEEARQAVIEEDKNLKRQLLNIFHLLKSYPPAVNYDEDDEDQQYPHGNVDLGMENYYQDTDYQEHGDDFQADRIYGIEYGHNPNADDDDSQVQVQDEEENQGEDDQDTCGNEDDHQVFDEDDLQENDLQDVSDHVLSPHASQDVHNLMEYLINMPANAQYERRRQHEDFQVNQDDFLVSDRDYDDEYTVSDPNEEQDNLQEEQEDQEEEDEGPIIIFIVVDVIPMGYYTTFPLYTPKINVLKQPFKEMKETKQKKKDALC